MVARSLTLSFQKNLFVNSTLYVYLLNKKKSGMKSLTYLSTHDFYNTGVLFCFFRTFLPSSPKPFCLVYVVNRQSKRVQEEINVRIVLVVFLIWIFKPKTLPLLLNKCSLGLVLDT